MRRHCKLIISVITMALIFSFVFAPASYALSGQSLRAFVAAALTALNITVQSTVIPAIDVGSRFIDFLDSPYKIVADQIVDIPYTFSDSDLTEYLSRSVIKIDKDVVTIDGVEYTKIWLSTDAAEKFRVNAFDIENAFDLASNSEGVFVSGYGSIYGIPTYNSDGLIRTPAIVLPVGQSSKGQVSFFNHLNNNGVWIVEAEAGQESTAISSLTMPPSARQAKAFLTGYTQGNNELYVTFNNGSTWKYAVFGSNQGISEPFDFDWTSAEIPADVPLTTQGLQLLVPTQTVEPWYTDYPEIGPNETFDMSLPDIDAKIDDLIDLIIPLIPVIDADFTDYVAPQPEPPAPVPEPIPVPVPYPEPDPQPGTVLPDVDFTSLFDVLKNIYNSIAEGNAISNAIKNLLDKIKWFLDDFFDDLGDLLQRVPEFFEKHAIDTIRDSLSRIKGIFLPIFNALKNALGIWHYVVEWFAVIVTPFTYFLNIIKQGYPMITMPIYASIAGWIVIAVYRRFGR